MAFGDSSRSPYLLGEWPRKYRHALITPATRWRVFIEDQQQIEHDVILNTVLRLRQAGEKDASKISDLLQLPVDLIRHLLATADQERLDAANSGQSTVSVRSTVGWVYRDAATGELWPQPGEQVEALDIRFSGSFRGRFDIGTAGLRSRVDALLLDARETGDLTPTAADLARFSRSEDAQKRTAVISSGEHCLVASPVSRDKSGLAVLTTQGVPQLSLGRLLNSALEKYEPVAKWAKDLPLNEAESQKSSLELALDELVELLGHLRAERFGTVSSSHLLSHIELCLGRCADDFSYRSGLAAVGGRPTADQTQAAEETFSLPPNVVKRWAGAPRSDSRRKVLDLLVARPAVGDRLVRDLSVVASRYDSIAGRTCEQHELIQLAQEIVNIGQLLLIGEGVGHVQQEK